MTNRPRKWAWRDEMGKGGTSSDLEFDYWQVRRWARAWKHSARRWLDAIETYQEYAAYDKARIAELEDVLRYMMDVRSIECSHAPRRTPDKICAACRARKVLGTE